MAIDVEIYTEREIAGIWDDANEEKDDPWDFSVYSSVRIPSVSANTLTDGAIKKRMVVASAKEQALSGLIPMLLKGSPVLSAEKLCQIASLNMDGGVKYPDIELLLLMADYDHLAYAQRGDTNIGEHGIKSYASSDWRYFNFSYESNNKVCDFWPKHFDPRLLEILISLPIVLSFEVDIDVDKKLICDPTARVQYLDAPSREFHIAAPCAELQSIMKFVVAHSRYPEKYRIPKNLVEWRVKSRMLNSNDYICKEHDE